MLVRLYYTFLLLVFTAASPSFAKHNNITVSFTTASSGNSHFSFAATASSTLNPVQYLWDFGDGSSTGWVSNDIVHHTYAVSGTYIVTLTAKNTAGETATAVEALTAYRYPGSANADFTISPQPCYSGSAVQFTNTSVNGSGTGTATARNWSFGDWVEANNIENPVHVYAAPGIYQVRLNAGNDTTVKLLRVLQGGVFAQFRLPADTVCKYDPVPFTDASYSTAGTIVSWSWNFGDGASSFSQNPTHIYSYPAGFTVSLIVMDNTGKKDTLSKNIQVRYRTNADFTYTPAVIYAGDTIQLRDSSVGVCDTIRTLEWMSMGPEPQNNFFWHAYGAVPPTLLVYPSAGTYSITHWVNGDTAVKTVTVYAGGNRSICPGAATQFTVSTAGSTYQWQESSDSGLSYHALQNDGFYFSGVNSNTLSIDHAPSNWYGRLYRCLADGLPVARYRLQFGNSFSGTGAWEDTASWSCHVLPDAYTDVVISSGTVTVNSNAICRSLKVLPGAAVLVSPGFNLTVVH